MRLVKEAEKMQPQIESWKEGNTEKATNITSPTETVERGLNAFSLIKKNKRPISEVRNSDIVPCLTRFNRQLRVGMRLVWSIADLGRFNSNVRLVRSIADRGRFNPSVRLSECAVLNHDLVISSFVPLQKWSSDNGLVNPWACRVKGDHCSTASMRMVFWCQMRKSLYTNYFDRWSLCQGLNNLNTSA